MKFLFDLFPVILFFITFKVAERQPEAAAALASGILGPLGGLVTAPQAPILLATGVAILASFAQIGWLLLRRRKIDTMLWVSLAIIVVFGGATLLLRDEAFIKWKPTVLYWLFGATLLISAFAFRKNLIRALMGTQMQLPDVIWTRLNLSWVGFFVFMGLANLYVAFNFSTDTWVNFKLFGGIGLMVLFVLGQSLFLAKYLEDVQPNS
ncbi:MAG: septation protein A [Thiotrichales bacterium]